MIVVVGTGRSGTTAASRTLQEKLGVDMGGPGRKHKSNPTGDYEDRHLRNNIDAPYHRGNITREEWESRLLEHAAKKEEPWGWKDPRNAHFLDEILDIFPCAHIIWARRRFGDVVESWMKWYNRTAEAASLEIEARLRGIQNALRKHGKDALKIDFTNHVDETELAVQFYFWLSERGQTGLIDPTSE